MLAFMQPLIEKILHCLGVSSNSLNFCSDFHEDQMVT